MMNRNELAYIDKIKQLLIAGAAILLLFSSCSDDDDMMNGNSAIEDTVSYTFDPTPYNFDLPSNAPPVVAPEDNPTTEEGVELGRMLFYDPILSADSSLACAGCHVQSNSFTDDRQFSTGIDGSKGTRNAMQLVNVAYNKHFNWHGSANSLEEQALEPVTNPLEMAAKWPDVVKRIQNTERYPKRFGETFNSAVVTKERVAKAIAQFERTLLSFNSKFDQVKRNEKFFTEAELNGKNLFFTEEGDCFHCHGGPLLKDLEFHNNGLDSTFEDDPGRFQVTGDPLDKGLFKTPTLRNIELTGPYMHDGRFKTLREVIDFYSEGLIRSETIDPLMKNAAQGGVELTEQEKNDLIAFLKTFTDKEFLNNEEHSNPFKE